MIDGRVRVHDRWQQEFLDSRPLVFRRCHLSALTLKAPIFLLLPDSSVGNSHAFDRK